MVDGILFDMDMFGGMVVGVFDCVDIIVCVCDIKLVWVFVNDMNCSVGQLFVSVVFWCLVMQIVWIGFIGVMMVYSNYGVVLEKQGVEIMLIYSGSYKVDGNFYSYFLDDVWEILQFWMDVICQMFVQKVLVYIGLFVQVVLDIEVVVYSGQEVIDVGLVDEFVNSIDVIIVMCDVLDVCKFCFLGG